MRSVISCGRSKYGQVWIETVIYTLIGLAIIGLVLAGALPKIQKKKDEMAISRSIEALRNIDEKVYEVSRAVGSRRAITLEVKKGSLIINSDDDSISWILDSSFEYSELNEEVSFGRIKVTTTKDGDYKVKLMSEYNVDLRYDGEDWDEKEFSVAPTPYRLVIENTGKDDASGKIRVNILEI